MRNLLLALGIGAALFLLLWLTGLLSAFESSVPGVLAAMIAYFVLARRTFKSVEAIFNTAAQSLQTMPPRFELAIQQLQAAYVYAPVQIGVRTQVDSQVGVLYFLQQEFNSALPPLKASLGFGHWIGAGM